jgi:voltage-dependent potassium channel beta subunit
MRMEYRRMGRTGLKLSAISLGAWVTFGAQIDERTAVEVLRRAYDLGVNYFDNADVYAGGQAETVMGKAIRGLPREALVVSSKVFWPTMEGPNGRGLSRKHIRESCEASLRRLGLEYLDLYFCHRYDPETPIEEVARAMDDLVHQGKVIYWGTSEWKAGHIAQACSVAREQRLYPPAVEQPHYNMLVRRMVEDELGPVAANFGIGLVTWSPLRSGLLSGKYSGGIPEGSRLSLAEYAWLKDLLSEENLRKTRDLAAVASDLGVTPAQLAIGWILRLPRVTSVITGATKASQLEENLKAVEVPPLLTSDVLERIEGILGNKPGREP